MSLGQILKQYNWLMNEAQSIKTRLVEIKSWLEGSSTRITGLPCSGKKIDKIGDGISNMICLQDVLNKRLSRCVREISFIESTINKVPDSENRNLLMRRYIYGQTWSKIAEDLGYKDESVPRKKCARLEKSLSL